MRKYYSEPELEIRKYGISANVFTDSNEPDLNDDDYYELDAAGNPVGEEVFAD